MKKITSFFAGAALLALGGCNLLDLAPIDYNAGDSFWTSEAKVTTFYNGLLTSLRADYSSPNVLGEFRGGVLKTGVSIEGVGLSYGELAGNLLSADATSITSWNSYYSRLLQVNHMIENLENGCDFMDDAMRNLYRGRVYGLRAYYYFMLYRTFGGVPLETSVKVAAGKVDVNDLYMARASAEETLQQIKDDIKVSEDSYGTNHDVDPYGWSYYATELLKARVYLWSAKVTTRCGKFDDPDAENSVVVEDVAGRHNATWPASDADLLVAREALENIIRSGEFGLLDNYADVFSPEHKASKEIILANYFDRTETTNSYESLFVYQAAIWTGSFYDEDGVLLGDPLELCGSGMHRIEYREGFIKSFDKADTRRAATFHECYSSADPNTRAFGSSMIKYMGHREDDTRYSDSDIPLMRYADVLLSMAEVENALGNYDNAAGYVNQVRQRAYGNSYPALDASDFATNELAILKERDHEFVGEGSRWFDLLRMHDANHQPLVFSADAAYPVAAGGTAEPVLNTTQTHLLLWPVDAGVLAEDYKIVQTIGY